MQAFRALFAILPMILTAGALVLLILTLLSGATTSRPLNKFWYLTAAITEPGTQSPDGMTHWTNYNYCGSQNGENVNCGPTKAAYGFAPARQLQDPSPAVPAQAVAHDYRSYITSRVYYSFLLIATFFTLIAMLSCIAGFFGRIGAVIGLMAALVAWAMTVVAAALMTTVYVRGRNYFRSAGIDAHVGVKLFAFMWTAVAALGLALFIFAIGACIPGESREPRKRRRNRAASYQEKPLITDSEAAVPVAANHNSTYVAPVVDNEQSLYTSDLPRSSYERVGKDMAPPIDGLHTTAERGYESNGTGATYVR